MKKKFTKKDIGRKVEIIYDFEKFSNPKNEKEKINPVDIAINLGVKIVDYGEILNVSKKYFEIKRKNPLRENPVLEMLDDYLSTIGNNKRKIFYSEIKEYKFLS